MLRVLETHCVTPVGSNEDRHIDVRVIAATNRDLEKMVREGEFREELYYRLNVVSITLPPLRERPEDIEILVHHFLDDLSRTYDRPAPVPDAELMQSATCAAQETCTWATCPGKSIALPTDIPSPRTATAASGR